MTTKYSLQILVILPSTMTTKYSLHSNNEQDPTVYAVLKVIDINVVYPPLRHHQQAQIAAFVVMLPAKHAVSCVPCGRPLILVLVVLMALHLAEPPDHHGELPSRLHLLHVHLHDFGPSHPIAIHEVQFVTH